MFVEAQDDSAMPDALSTAEHEARYDRMIAGVKREAAAEALEQAAVELETTLGRGHQVLRDIRASHAAWLREVAAEYRRNEGDTA